MKKTFDGVKVALVVSVDYTYRFYSTSNVALRNLKINRIDGESSTKSDVELSTLYRVFPSIILLTEYLNNALALRNLKIYQIGRAHV